MRKILCLVLALVLALSNTPLMARTIAEDRRIEEEKRQSLRPTEAPVEKKEPVYKAEVYVNQAYFSGLLSRRVTRLSDICKVLTVLIAPEYQEKDIESQVALLAEKGIIPRKAVPTFDPNEPLRKGLAAYMFCKALDIKGGLAARVFGMNERYAMKELIFEEMMYPGDARDIVCGKELIVMVTRSAEYLAQGKEGRAKR